MIFIIAFVFGALGAVVGVVAGSFTARGREKDKKAANHFAIL